MRWPLPRKAADGAAAPSDRDDSDKLKVVSEKAGAEAAVAVFADKSTEPKPVPLLALWRYATSAERAVNAVACLAAIAAGIAQPSLTIALGGLVNNFSDFQGQVNAGVGTDASALTSAVDRNLAIMAGIGLGLFLTSYVQNVVFALTSERIARRVRERYLAAYLHQDIAAIEAIGAGEVATRLTTSTNLFQIGIGDKAPQFVQYTVMFGAGVTIAFIRNWRMSLVLLSIFPAIGLAGSLALPAMTSGKRIVLDHLARAGTLAEEAISSIRTVQAYNTRDRLVALYDEPNADAQAAGKKTALGAGWGVGSIIFIIYSGYALAFWWGATLRLRGDATVGEIVTCFLSLVLGAMGANFVTISLQAMSTAAAAAAKLYETIEAKPAIDSASITGLRLPRESLRGELAFRHVDFRYPARPDRPVFSDLSVTFAARQVTAICGESGAGKSSAIALIERFYDYHGGDITLDGVSIRDLNLRWLRGQIGLVQQEPVLLSGTVYDNVVSGLMETPFENAPDEEKRLLAVEACKKANAHAFVSSLPEGYDTRIGERGLRLSGGQRQRIAIARAIVGDPPILLLDEATSALDTASEALVQDALDEASRGRTTITIAHRISTIRNADVIHCVGQGQILESGNHDELVAAGGMYARLVAAQRIQELNKPAIGEDLATPSRTYSAASNTILDKLPQLASEDVATAPTARSWSSWAVIRRIVLLDRSLWLPWALGLTGCVLVGLVYPIFAIIFGQILGVFAEVDPQVLRSRADRLAGLFFAVACVGGFGAFFEMSTFAYAAEAVARRLRADALRATLRQDPEFYDLDINSAGALTSAIGDRAEKVHLFFTNAGFLIQACVTLLGGCIVGLAYSWRIALVAIACLPFTIGAGVTQLYVIFERDMMVEKAHADASQMACEAAAAVKTIASLNREDEVVRLYSVALQGPQAKVTRTAIWVQLLASFLQASTFFVVAVVYYYGSRLLAGGTIAPNDFFIAIQAIVFASMEVGCAVSFPPLLK